MNKKILSILISAAILIGSHAVEAGSLKIIKLKDGSTLKGNVISLSRGVYTFQSENLGEIEIHQDDILSISSPSAVSGKTNTLGGTSTVKNSNLERQVDQIQGTIMTDPEIMMEMQTIVQDEEVQKLLSDPNLINDIQSFDQNKIEQNQNVQDLMKNPKIQELMNKVLNKMPAE